MHLFPRTLWRLRSEIQTTWGLSVSKVGHSASKDSHPQPHGLHEVVEKGEGALPLDGEGGSPETPGTQSPRLDMGHGTQSRLDIGTQSYSKVGHGTQSPTCEQSWTWLRANASKVGHGTQAGGQASKWPPGLALAGKLDGAAGGVCPPPPILEGVLFASRRVLRLRAIYQLTGDSHQRDMATSTSKVGHGCASCGPLRAKLGGMAVAVTTANNEQNRT